MLPIRYQTDLTTGLDSANLVATRKETDMKLYEVTYTSNETLDDYQHKVRLWGGDEDHALEGFYFLFHNRNLVSIEEVSP